MSAESTAAGALTGSVAKYAGGRPMRGASVARVVPVRMNDDELEDLDRKAFGADLSRSELIRRAVAAYGA